MNFQIAEDGTVEIPEYFVMVAWNENHLGASLGFTQDGAQYVVMGLRPEHAFLHAPDIDDVAHQKQSIHLDVVEKIEQQVGATALEAQMNVGDEDRS
jgi:hypothetical protein